MAVETYAIILAGGAGSRLDRERPKQFIKIAGRAVLDHAVAPFEAFYAITGIVLVVPPEMTHEQRSVVEEIVARAKTPIRTVAGGPSRNQSTCNALAAIGDDESFVLIHDAARPLLDAEVIERCIDALQFYDAVDVVIPCADTIVEVDGANCIKAIPNRAALRRGQTPQGFRTGVLREAYRRAAQAEDLDNSDDCGVVLKYMPEVAIRCVEGAQGNLKITDPIDLVTADRLFQLRTTTLAGLARDAANLEAGPPKAIVVFGASSGIGEALAAQARGRGDDVLGFSLSLGDTDVRNVADIDRALAEAHATFGRIDAVVNTSAVLNRGPLDEQSVADIRESLDTNLLGAFLVARQSLPYLRASRGQLIVFASSSFTRGRASYATYSAAKAGIVNMTQALSEEFGPQGVRVNCVCPERTATRMRRQAFAGEDQSLLLDAAEVAAVTLDLIDSPITGQVVDVRRTAQPDASPRARAARR